MLFNNLDKVFNIGIALPIIFTLLANGLGGTMYYIKSDFNSKTIASSTSLEEAFANFRKTITSCSAGIYKVMMEDQNGLLWPYYYLHVYKGNIKLESLID